MATTGFVAPQSEIEAPAPQAQGFVAPQADIDAAKPFTASQSDVEAAQALDLINGKSSKELAVQPDFKPAQFYAQHKDILTPEHVDKLADALRQRTETGLTGATAVEGLKTVPESVASFFRGGWQFLKHAPSFMPTASEAAKANTYRRGVGFVGTPEKAKELTPEQDKKRTAEQAEALAGLETATTGVGGLFRSAVRNYVNQEGTRWVANKLGIEPETLGLPAERLNADVTNPSTFAQPVDWKQRLFDDAALGEQQSKAAEGKGEVLKAINTDADTLAKQGVTLDPAAIQDLSAFENPVNFVPFGEGLGGAITTAAGKVLGRAVSREAAEAAIKGFGGTITKAGEAVSNAGAKLAQAKAGVGSVAGAALLHHNPAVAAAVAAAPSVVKVAGKTIQVAGALTEKAAAPALTLATKATEGAVGGASVALPFAAASDDPTDITANLGAGAALGAGGHLLGEGAKAVKDTALRKAEGIVAQSFQSAPDTAPVAPHPEYGTDATLDEANRLNMNRLRENDPATANLADRLRHLASGLDTPTQKHEIYFLSPESFDSVVPEEQRGARGRTEIIKNEDGTTTHRALVRLDSADGHAQAFHEAGHVIMNAMPEDVRSEFVDAIKSAYGSKFKDFWNEYSRTAPTGTKYSENYVANEIGAELLTGVLRGMPLDNAPVGVRQKVVQAAAHFLDLTGIYQPGLERGTPLSTELGVKLSPEAAAPSRNFVEQLRQKVGEAPAPPHEGPVPPRIPTQEPFVAPDHERETDAQPGLATTPPEDLTQPQPVGGGAEPGSQPGLATRIPPELLTQDQSLFGRRVQMEEQPPVTPAPVPEAQPPVEPAKPLVIEQPAAPNLRGKSEKDYNKFQGEARNPANQRVEEAKAAVDASKDLTDEQKQAVQTLLSNLRTPHDVTYNAAKNEAGSMERAPRRADIEAARSNPELREVASKLASIPLDARATKNGDVQLQFWSGDKVLNNLDALVAQPKALEFIPYEKEGGKLTQKGQAQLAKDLQDYTANQDNGYRGDGQKLNRPSNPQGFIPDENPDYTPVRIPKGAADFINLLMGEDPPETARMNAGTVPIQARAKTLAEANAHQGIEIKPRKTYKAPFENVAISDYNPLRVEMQEAGVNTSKLTEAHEWVNAKEIQSATPRPDIKLSPTSTDVTAAGFMPAAEAGAPRSEIAKAKKEWREKGTESPFFKRWFGNSKVVDEEGNPEVVFHGTTHKFKAFSNDRGNVENWLGVGHYFSSERFDAQGNYSTESGPDLNNRIEGRADRLENEGLSREKAKAQATKELVGKTSKVIPAYLKLENPVVMDKKGGTRFEYHFDDETGQEAGSAMDLYNSVMRVARQFDMDGQRAWEKITENGLEDVTAYDVANALKHAGLEYGIINSKGESTGPEFARAVFEDMGFDGVVFNHPSEEFRNMGIPGGTKHYIAFKPEQIKSTDNRGTFNPNEPAFQFLPSKEPRALKTAAVRDEETGKVYEGPMHALAKLEYLKDKHKAELDEDGNLPVHRELGAWNSSPNLTEGSVTNEGEFLNREDAFKRADEMKQLTQAARDKMQGSYESDAFSKLRADKEEPAQQFMPKSRKEIDDEVTKFLGNEKFWLDKSGNKKSTTDHAKEFSNGEKINNDNREVYAQRGLDKGSLRVEVVDDTLWLEGKQDHFESLPRAQREAIEDMAINRGLAVRYNTHFIDGFGDDSGMQFMGKLSREAVQQFMPASEDVDLKDYIGKPLFVLTTDRMGVGSMGVGPKGAKQPLNIPAQGGRGFMHIYKGGGWAFADQGAAKRFLTRVRQVAGDNDSAIAALTVLGESNHMNSPTGLAAYHQALQAAVDSGAVGKGKADAHIKEIFQRLGDTKSKLVTDKNRELFQNIKTLRQFGKAVANKQFNFEAAKHLMERANQRTLPIHWKEAQELGIDVPSVARDIRDPGLHDVPTGQVVGLVEIPKDAVPEETGFHFSYPWSVEGKAIGFLKDTHHVSKLTSDQRIYQAPGRVGAQPLMTVMPHLDRMEQLALQFMPAKDAPAAEKSLADGLRERVRRAQIVSVDDAVKALGSYPRYLDGVVNFLSNRREALKNGDITMRDLAKAYAITVASQGADSIKLSTLQKSVPGFSPDKSFLTADGEKIRPEEAAAWWLGTPEGKEALDNVQHGKYDAADWEGFAKIRKAFGDDRVFYSGMLLKPGESAERPIYETDPSSRAVLKDEQGNPKPTGKVRKISMGEDENSMANLESVLDRINEAKGDGDKLMEAVQNLRGIGPAKAPFISHMLGFGGDITLDAVEMNYWLTGKGSIKHATPKQKEFVDAVKHDEGSQSILKDRIVKRLMKIREQSPAAAAIPEEAYLHVMHHWLWDRAKGSETTHAGVYKAALQFMPGKTKTATFSADDIRPINVKGRGHLVVPVARRGQD